MAKPKQWNLDLVNAEKAYAMLPRLPNSDIVDWREIEVGHIDTGVRRHFAFGPWTDCGSDTVRLEDGRNLLERDSPPLDPMDYKKEDRAIKINPGHGTRTASVICGYDLGRFKGVAPGVPLIPYRAVNGVDLSGKVRIKPVAEALRHAVFENGCEVVSISLGNVGRMRLVEMALDEAYANGVIVVAAGGQGTDYVVRPARYARSIAVGGVRADRKVWHRYYRDSATGDDHARFIDVWAPADDQLVATSCRESDKPGAGFHHGYVESHGTSFATAHVSAAAAMWLAVHGERIDTQYPRPWQRVEAFRALIRATGSKIKGKYPRKKNTGILDIEALLDAPLPKPGKLKER